MKNSRCTTGCREIPSHLDSTCILIGGIDRQLPCPISETQYYPLNFHHLNIISRKSFTGVELHGKTLGVVGCGRIGQVTTQAFLQTLFAILRIRFILKYGAPSTSTARLRTPLYSLAAPNTPILRLKYAFKLQPLNCVGCRVMRTNNGNARHRI